MADLAGHVALVTGGSRGLGAATALALAEAGADVAVMGRSAAALDEVRRAIGARGRRSLVAVGDVAQWEQTRAAVAEVERGLGPISILVNNAGRVTISGPVTQTDPATWADELAVDLNGPFYCVRATLEGMTRRGWGRILNVTSGAGAQPIAGAAAYSVAKAGLNYLTRILAIELAETGVVPIAVSPGMLDTQMQASIRATPTAEADYFREAHAQGRLRPVEEPAALIRWLCGPEGAAFAGQVASVNSPEIRERVGLPALG